MKILITGCAGYVGTSLVSLLLRKNYQVVGFDNLMFGGNQLLPFFSNTNFSFINGDIVNIDNVKNAVKDVDIIVHLAAIVGLPACDKNPDLTKAVNVKGTKNILNCMNDKQVILFGSTGSNYGNVEGICTEDSPLKPLSLYAETKTEAEKMIMESGNGIAYRFATAFGISSRMRQDLLVNDFVNKSIRDGYLVVYEKNFMRTFIHVNDMANAFLFGIQNKHKMIGEIYNVGDSSMGFTKEVVCEMIAKKTDSYVHYAPIGKDIDQRNYIVSFEKINRLGFKTQFSLEEGVDELIRCKDVIDVINPYVNALNIN